MQPKWLSFFTGLLILFVTYHFPEFFSALWIAAVFKIGFLIVAEFYVLNHIWRLTEGVPVLSYLFILGIALAWALSFTRSLWLTLGIHWGANIAFEMINAATTTQTVNKSITVWILAACYALMLAVMIFTRRLFPVRK